MVSVNEKFHADSILFRKDMLSKAEYNLSKDEKVSVRTSLSTLDNERRKVHNDKSLLINVHSREKNTFLVRKVELDEQEEQLKQTKNQITNQLSKVTASAKQAESDLEKQYVIAGSSGIINFVFNKTNTSNLIAKGDLLISVAPEDIDYYAKVFISQKDFPHLKTGFEARLKLDAYYYFEYGIIKGKVFYLSERKENEKFYALIQLPSYKTYDLKSGYTLRGEIVVQRMPLYKYFIKKIFKRYSQ